MDTERERDIAAANAGVTDSEGEDEDEDEAKDNDGAANGDKPADNDGAADEDKGVGSKVRIIWLLSVTIEGAMSWPAHACALSRILNNIAFFFKSPRRTFSLVQSTYIFPIPKWSFLVLKNHCFCSVRCVLSEFSRNRDVYSRRARSADVTVICSAVPFFSDTWNMAKKQIYKKSSVYVWVRYDGPYMLEKHIELNCSGQGNRTFFNIPHVQRSSVSCQSRFSSVVRLVLSVKWEMTLPNTNFQKQKGTGAKSSSYSDVSFIS